MVHCLILCYVALGSSEGAVSHIPSVVWGGRLNLAPSLLPSHSLSWFCRCSGTWRRACSAGRYLSRCLSKEPGNPCCLTPLPEDSWLLIALSIVWSDSWLGRKWAVGWLGCLIQSFFSFLSVLLSPTQLFGFTECFGVVLPSLSDSQENRGLAGFQQFLKSLQSGPTEGELGG